MKNANEIAKGDIILVDPDPVVGSEQSGIRPYVIISGNTMNKYFDMVLACPLSSVVKRLPGSVLVKPNKTNRLKTDSEIITLQIRSISKKRCIKRIGRIDKEDFHGIVKGLFALMNY